MDLLEFDGEGLYFDEKVSSEVTTLMDEAASLYSKGESELPLLRAFLLAPENLVVLVGLYRFYFYQHKLDLALEVAHRVLIVSGGRLSFPPEWRKISMSFVGGGVLRSSMGMVRFYLLALKAAGYLNIRLGDIDEGKEMLRKVCELDSEDRLGAGLLLSEIDGSPEVSEDEDEDERAAG